MIRREFVEFVRTKTFIITTLLGPVFLVGLLFLPLVFASGSGADERTIVIVDETGEGLGEVVAGALPSPDAPLPVDDEARRWRTEVLTAGDEALRADLQQRIASDELDGFLWIPPGAVAGGDTVRYIGENATNFRDMGAVGGAVEQGVRQHRLATSGVDPEALATILAPVPFEERTAGETGAGSSIGAAMILGQILGFSIYIVVLLYGQAVLRGVLEEKRDRIVEIVLSSIRARDLMFGKVAGIGAAGLLQMLVWVGFAAAVLVPGRDIIASYGVDLPFTLPAVPLSLGVAFVVFFLGGYFVYASLYAAVGAMATNDQEAQQLQMPIMLIIMLALFAIFAVINEPNGTLSIFASIFPLTSPIIMPVRFSLTSVPALQLGGSVLALVAGAAAVVWLSARIYRVGVLSTGKRPTLRELGRWFRTG